MTAIRIAALFGFLAVALGAFGAHKLQETLTANGRVATWETAAQYHLIHAVVLLALAFQLASSGGAGSSPAFWLFAIGIVIFSGSLYVLALTNFTKLGMVTPIGGLCLIAGWLYLAIKGLR